MSATNDTASIGNTLSSVGITVSTFSVTAIRLNRTGKITKEGREKLANVETLLTIHSGKSGQHASMDISCFYE
jgi:hypothetical protein